MKVCYIALLVIVFVTSLIEIPGRVLADEIEQAELWQSQYSGEDSQGEKVIGHWSFDTSAVERDSGPLKLTGQLDGATSVESGKFGGGIESFPGYPIADKHCAFVVQDHPALSPAGSFTIEMWVKPKPELAEASLTYLIDKRYASQNDYQWYLSQPDSTGLRSMTVVLGFGNEVEYFSTEPMRFEVGKWQHIAFSYDGAGTVRFYRNGSSAGSVKHPQRFGIAAGAHHLSIGDRVGSNYGGFPGFIDEVRITKGVREYCPLKVSITVNRTVWRRNEPKAEIRVTVKNLLRESIGQSVLNVSSSGWLDETIKLPELSGGESFSTLIPFNTSLRPDDYVLQGSVTTTGDNPVTSTTEQTLRIMPRPLPHRMPVLMWGISSPTEFDRELSRLQELGFNHCLGFSPSPYAVWEAKHVVPADTPAQQQKVREMLDKALANDFGIAASLYAGYFLKKKTELARVDREGKTYARSDCNAALPGLAEFSENFGRSVGEMYGEHPAFVAALINSEVRDSTHVSFSEYDFEQYQKYSGEEIPHSVVDKIGPAWSTLPGFPKNRVLPDDDALLRFYRWFWTVGDGWNPLHTALHRGLQADGRERIWSFFDPAIRVPSVGGSGGQVDVLSQWTYTEPSPLRVGYFCDELFAMAEASGHQQDVMKMTQLFWYRSSSAPKKSGKEYISSPFDDHDPDAAYISIAPMHLRGSFWTKLSRPVKGLMYHGWSSLVPTDGTHAYKYTQPDLKTEFRRLHREILPPLGPTLMQVPDRQTDVAYLESFTSQMFARRGSYGYSYDEAYLTLLHAQIQPEVIYEQTLLKKGLDQYKVLILSDCDVLTESVVAKILDFQQQGGIVIGDPNLTPAIKPTIVIPKFIRTKRTDEDQRIILANAAKLRKDLGEHYRPYAECTALEIVTRTRSTGDSDYLFVVNDRREFGTYVGQHGLVMENGLPSKGTLKVRRKVGFVYDLLARREVTTERENGVLTWPVELGPCAGNIFLLTPEPIADVNITGDEEVTLSDSMQLAIAVVGPSGKPIPAVLPLNVLITDPTGRKAEFSGYYGAAEGQLKLTLQIAQNDYPGIWQVKVQELASGVTKSHYFRVR
ncbi:LamG domain-containing protein [Gimesia sp.]|uniref:LamG domain-containing protein n=1 Tax=Gimesia sp. TaxID=2024833 RepID=UPI003A90BB6F